MVAPVHRVSRCRDCRLARQAEALNHSSFQAFCFHRSRVLQTGRYVGPPQPIGPDERFYWLVVVLVRSCPSGELSYGSWSRWAIFPMGNFSQWELSKTMTLTLIPLGGGGGGIVFFAVHLDRLEFHVQTS